jgi:hypothetical protein
MGSTAGVSDRLCHVNAECGTFRRHAGSVARCSRGKRVGLGPLEAVANGAAALNLTQPKQVSVVALR